MTNPTHTQAPATDVAKLGEQIKGWLNKTAWPFPSGKEQHEAVDQLVALASQAPTQPSGDAGAGVVPKGWKPAPLEPTEAMLEAAEVYRNECHLVDRPLKTSRLYVAMLAASPQVREQAALPDIPTAKVVGPRGVTVVGLLGDLAASSVEVRKQAALHGASVIAWENTAPHAAAPLGSSTTVRIGVPAPSQQWKLGNEFAPFHPSASFIDPSYRDGWNACYRAALTQGTSQAAAPAVVEDGLTTQPSASENGGKTGSPPGLLQDDCRGLSKWLSSRPDALRRVREACAEIEAGITQEKTNG